MKNLRRNAAFNVLGWALPTLIFLGLTPVMVNKLGLEAFGIVSLIQVVTGYMNVLNFGFSEAIIKQVAASFEKDRAQAGRVAWVGFQLFAAFGALGALVIFVCSNWLAFDLLKVGQPLQADTAAALRVAALIFLLQMLAEFYRGVSIGCQRFDVPNLSRVLRIALSGVFILFALYSGGGIASVMWASLAGLVVGLVVNAWWMQRVLPLAPAPGDLAAIRREVYHYSKHVFTMRLAGMLSTNLGQLFLGTLSSATAVGLYQVPVRVAETGSVFLGRILQVFFPGFSAMDLKTDGDRIRSIFRSAFSLQLLFMTPLFLCMVLEGPALLALWINAEFARESAGIILIVGVTYWLSSLTNLPSSLALSFNAPDVLSKASLVRVAIVVATGYPLVLNFGLLGAAWLLLLSELQAFWFIHQSVVRTIGRESVATTFRPMALHAGTALLLYLLYAFWWRQSPFFTPYALPLAAIAHLAIVCALGAVGPAERRRLARMFARG